MDFCSTQFVVLFLIGISNDNKISYIKKAENPVNISFNLNSNLEQAFGWLNVFKILFGNPI